jgi:hypothetical protein
MTDNVEGGCLCGAVRYDAPWPPTWSAHCHCSDCRKATGSAFATYAGILRDRFRWTKGAPKEVHSSPGVTRSFCGTCGTPLAYRGDRWPTEIHILAATLDDPSIAAPEAHMYTSEQLPWVHLADGLPRKAKTEG